MQKRAIVWGTVGAVGVRVLMTLLVVRLLSVPGLLFAGGTLLLWIAYRLLLSGASERAARGRAATSFWSAMSTIVVADAVMGLDNVLAVAGAAHGSDLLVVAGLVISVPLVVWGSTLVLGIVRRFPGLIYAGAGVLLWTAVKMITAEPLLKSHFEEMPLLAGLIYLAIPLVLWAGFANNHRHVESRIRARLAMLGEQLRQGALMKGGRTMLKVLVPVDGSPNALRAVRRAMAEYRRDHELELHLLNVQPRLSHHITRFVGRRDRDAWLQERAGVAMAGATALLSESGVQHYTHWASGDRAGEICRVAESLGVHRIVMGIARKHSLTRMFEDSVTEQVLQATPVPVEVVVGDAVSKWERWGWPVGVLTAGSLLFAALD